MNEEIINPQEGLEKYKKTTELILSLPESLVLQNNWGKKELVIHLWVWDKEFLKNLYAALEERKISWDEKFKNEETLNQWNDEQIKKYSKLSYEKVVNNFRKTRAEVIKLYEKLLEKELSDEEKTLFTLWLHDLHHLRQADSNITV